MKVIRLVPYGGVTPPALLQQMTARLERAKADDRASHLIACVVEKNDDGNWVYRTYWSPLPAEVFLMAALELMKKATE